jgi:cysteine desulfurase/selenocysteine lyase
MTAVFEEPYDTIARFAGAPGRASIALPQHHRGDQRGHVLAAERVPRRRQRGDQDDEHNSSYVPWHAMCREILPRSGRRVDYRLVRFDPGAG